MKNAETSDLNAARTARPTIAGLHFTGDWIHFVSCLVVGGVYSLCRWKYGAADWSAVGLCFLASMSLLGNAALGLKSGVHPRTGAVVGRWFLGALCMLAVSSASLILVGDGRVFLCGMGLLRLSLLVYRTRGVRLPVAVLVGFVPVTVFCCCVFWGSGFINPLIDQLVLRGQVYQDVLMNMSVSEMIRTYGVSSTGLHGTPYFGYHWGAHAAIGLASSILSIPVSVGYSLLLPLTAIPLLLRFLFVSSAVYDVGAGSGGMLRTWFGILVLTLIVWPLVLLASPSGLPSGVPYSMPYVSESLLLSVVLSLILTTVFLESVRAVGREKMLCEITIAILVGMIVLSKVSTGFVVVAWLCLSSVWGAIARRSWKTVLPSIAVAAGALCLVVFTFADGGLVASRTAYSVAMSVTRFGYIRNLFFFLLPVLLVIVQMGQGCLLELCRFRYSTEGAHNAASMAGMLTFFLSPIPAVLCSFSDNEKYFYWTPVFVCSPWIVSAIANLCSRLRVNEHAALRSLLVVALFGAVSNEGLDLASDVRRGVEACGQTGGSRFRLLGFLAEIGKSIPISEKNHTALFISDEARAGSLRSSELADIFLPCAVSGLAQLLGNPVQGSDLSKMSTFSLSCYRPRSPTKPDSAELRAECIKQGFTTLIVVEKVGDAFQRQTLRVGEGKYGKF